MFKIASVTGLVVIGSFVFGFLTAINPNFFPLHLLVIAAIAGVMIIGYVNQSQAIAYYARAALIKNFCLRGVVAVAIYLIFVGVGGWLYTPPQISDLLEAL